GRAGLLLGGPPNLLLPRGRHPLHDRAREVLLPVEEVVEGAARVPRLLGDLVEDEVAVAVSRETPSRRFEQRGARRRPALGLGPSLRYVHVCMILAHAAATDCSDLSAEANPRAGAGLRARGRLGAADARRPGRLPAPGGADDLVRSRGRVAGRARAVRDPLEA